MAVAPGSTVRYIAPPHRATENPTENMSVHYVEKAYDFLDHSSRKRRHGISKRVLVYGDEKHKERLILAVNSSRCYLSPDGTRFSVEEIKQNIDISIPICDKI